MIDGLKRTSIYLIVLDETGQTYDTYIFGRIVQKPAGAPVIEGLAFHDLRRTVASEIDNRSAASAEILSMTGYSVNSPVLQEYVMPIKEVALNVQCKMNFEFIEKISSEHLPHR